MEQINFQELTLAEKRIAIAKDVIAQLDADKYIAEAGQYCCFRDMDVEMSDDIKKKFDEEWICDVCALGGLLVSLTHFNNKYTFQDLDAISCKEITSPFKELAEYFTLSQLFLIEAAFEGWTDFSTGVAHSMDYKPTPEELYLVEEHADAWEDNYYNDDRLRKIMKNIIQNGGEFVISDR